MDSKGLPPNLLCSGAAPASGSLSAQAKYSPLRASTGDPRCYQDLAVLSRGWQSWAFLARVGFGYLVAQGLLAGRR